MSSPAAATTKSRSGRMLTKALVLLLLLAGMAGVDAWRKNAPPAPSAQAPPDRNRPLPGGQQDAAKHRSPRASDPQAPHTPEEIVRRMAELSSGNKEDVAEWKRLMAVLEKMDAGQIRSALDVAFTLPVNFSQVQPAVRRIAELLGRVDPVMVLDYMQDRVAKFPDDSRGTFLLPWVLSAISEKEPDLAIDWQKSHPEFFSGGADGAKGEMLSTMARQDLSLALSKIDQLQFDDPVRAWRALAEGAQDLDTKTLLLEKLREAQAGLPADLAANMQTAVFLATSQDLGQHSFADASAWIDRQQFSDADLTSLAKGISVMAHPKETGQWLDWIGQHATPEQLAPLAGEHLVVWANRDPKAAESWVLACDDPLVKEQAIRGYAVGAAPVNMDSAVKMVMLLPDDTKREELLKQVEQSKTYVYGSADGE